MAQFRQTTDFEFYNELVAKGAIDAAPLDYDHINCVRIIYKHGLIVERGDSFAVDDYYIQACNQ